ncbi:MAG: cation:proton antiporter [Oscillospiraceae bacterium]|nr:cation:proton antiporter [Oscillospiraceae bacterium]
MEMYLICLASALIGGLMLSRLTKLLNLPAVTAYLVAGLLLGPFALGRLNIPGLGFQSLEQVELMGIVTQTALGFIAFTIGNEFRLSQLKSMGKSAITIGILQAVITTLVVDAILIGLHFCFPGVISIPCAITLGAIASATAPAATLMVVRQYKADGPLTRLLMLVVAIDDAVGLVLFSVSFGIATALADGQVSVLGVVVEPILEILLSIGLGGLMGWLLNWVEQFFHSRSKRMTISVAFVLLTVGLSSVSFEVSGVHCGFSLLLVCMMTGTVFCNICATSEELMERVDNWVMPLNVLFFVISGAELDLQVLANPVTILVGVVYILARSAGKWYGSAFSCRLTHQSKPITDNLGITLLPQAGVALGMALTAATLADGALARNVVLFAVLVYELVGPALTKRSLLAVGEIKPEGRTSARRPNAAAPDPTESAQRHALPHNRRRVLQTVKK